MVRSPSPGAREHALVLLARGIVPEVVVLFLNPKGNVEGFGGHTAFCGVYPIP